jgi:ornithine decarboxylase
MFSDMKKRGIELGLINLGGGFPTRYRTDVPAVARYGDAIMASLRKHFGTTLPDIIIEPGRGMVGNAGVIQAEVVLVSNKGGDDARRWVYLDVGKFHGLAETMVNHSYRHSPMLTCIVIMIIMEIGRMY